LHSQTPLALICCGFVVQQTVKQIHSKTLQQVVKLTATRTTTAILQQIHNKLNKKQQVAQLVVQQSAANQKSGARAYAGVITAKAGHFPPGPVNRGRFPLGHFPSPDVSPFAFRVPVRFPNRSVTTYYQSQHQD